MLRKYKKYVTHKNLIIGLVALLFVALAFAIYFYSQTRQNTDPQAQVEREALALVEEVGRLIVLPENETPTIATVSDPSRLQDQPFFAKAKTGDKVLLYSTARKAYLYDPVSKKLLEVAPLNIGSGEAGI